MRYEIDKKLAEQIFDGEKDTFSQREKLADYVESYGGKGIRLTESRTGEFNSLWGQETDKAKKKELLTSAFAQKLRTPIKFDKQKDLQQKNRIDSGVRSDASKVFGLSRRDVGRLSDSSAQSAVKMAGLGAGTSVAPSNVEKVLEERKALPGQMTGAQKVGDVVDAAVATPLLFKFLGGGKAAVTGVSRTLFSGFDQEADIDGLAGMSIERRNEFVNSLDDAYATKDVYKRIVKDLDKYEIEQGFDKDKSLSEEEREGLISSAASYKDRAALAFEYFKPMNTADPYGGNSPRPFKVSGTRGDLEQTPRAVDATDILLRGAFGLRGKELEDARANVQQVSSFIGAGPRAVLSGYKAAVLATEEAARKDAGGSNLGGLRTAGRFYREFPGLFASQLESDELDLREAIRAGDTSAGMGMANFALTISPDLAMDAINPRAVATVATSIGKMTRVGQKTMRVEKGQQYLKAADKVRRQTGKDLSVEQAVLLRGSVDNGVEALFAAAKEKAGPKVAAVDISDALSVRVGDDGGINVSLNPDKIVAQTASKKSPAFFPEQAPVVSVAKAAGKGSRKVVGAMSDMSGGILPLLANKTASGVDLAQSAFGKGQRLTVVDANGVTRPLTASRLIGDERWKLFRHVTGAKKRASQAAMNAEIDEALRKVLSGTAGPKERVTTSKYLEVLGRPMEDVRSAGVVFSAIEGAVKDALQFNPEQIYRRLEKNTSTAAQFLSGKAKRVSDSRTSRDKIMEQAKKVLKDLENLESNIGSITAEEAAKIRSKKQQLASLEKSYNVANRKYLDALQPQSNLDQMLLDSLDERGDQIRLLESVMKTITGSSSAGEAAGAQYDLMKVAQAQSQLSSLRANKKAVKAFAGLTVSDAKQAERAWERMAKGGQSIEELEGLSDGAREALVVLKDFYDGMYRKMKAQGRLGGQSKSEFFERVFVEGYVPHVLSHRGRTEMIKKINKGLKGRGEDVFSSAIASEKQRKIKGTINEINEESRRNVAKMFLDEEKKLAATSGRPVRRGTPDEQIEDVIDELGIRETNLFEDDIVQITRRYGSDVVDGLVNREMLKDVVRIFPEGERFTKLATEVGKTGKPILTRRFSESDKAARLEGYQRLKGVTLMRNVSPELLMWDGWGNKRVQEALNTLENRFSVTDVDNFYQALREAGAPLTESDKLQITEMFKAPIYLPDQVANSLSQMANPSMMEQFMKAYDRGLFGSSLNAYTSVWKAGMTIYSAAFHARNYISNIMSSFLTNGLDAVRPENMILSQTILTAPDAQKITVPLKKGNVIDGQSSVTMTAKEWRASARRHGWISDIVGGTFDDPVKNIRVDPGLGMKAMLAGAAAGAGAGAISGDKPEDRVKRAFFGALAGSLGSATATGGYQYYMKDAGKAFKESLGPGGLKGLFAEAVQNPERVREALPVAFKAAFDEAWNQVLKESLSKATKVGGVQTALTLGITGGNAPVAATAGLGAFAFSMLNDAVSPIVGGAGRHIEDHAKIQNALAEFRKSGSFADSGRAAVKATFDYDDLSAFEKNVMRKLFPFYTWNKKNLFLQAELMAEHPLRYNAIVKIMDAFEADYNAYEVPEYYGDRWLADVGVNRVIAGLNSPPEAAMELMLKGPLGTAGSMSNPLLKVMMERVFGRSFFRKMPLNRITSGTDYEKMPRLIQEDVGFVEGVVDPKTGEKFGSQIGFYKVPASEIARMFPPQVADLYVGKGEGGGVLRYRKDIPRAVKAHQIYMAHPVKRILGNFNTALKESFVPSADPSMPRQKASNLDRALTLVGGFKSRQLDPKTIQEYSYETIRMLKDLLRENKEMYDISVMPKRGGRVPEEATQ